MYGMLYFAHDAALAIAVASIYLCLNRRLQRVGRCMWQPCPACSRVLSNVLKADMMCEQEAIWTWTLFLYL